MVFVLVFWVLLLLFLVLKGSGFILGQGIRKALSGSSNDHKDLRESHNLFFFFFLIPASSLAIYSLEFGADIQKVGSKCLVQMLIIRSTGSSYSPHLGDKMFVLFLI